MSNIIMLLLPIVVTPICRAYIFHLILEIGEYSLHLYLSIL